LPGPAPSPWPSPACCTITDLVFTTQAAIAVVRVFFTPTAWRWWAIALYRKAREQAAAK
jgi:hypothetical protein